MSGREEEDEDEEEEEQALTGKEDLALRVDGTTSRERLMGITALVGGTTRPWYSKSLKRHEKSTHNAQCPTVQRNTFKKRSVMFFSFTSQLDIVIQASGNTYRAPDRHTA